MWKRKFNVDTSKQIPDTAGYNVLGSVYYVDKDFADAVKAGKVVVEGMTPAQIMHAIVLHERVEKALLDALNQINTYQEAHELATLAEHLFVSSLGAKPRLYEAAIKPYIKANETKQIVSPPIDLDCEPYNDKPDKDDDSAIAAMQKLGVADAGKVSKESVNYRKARGPDQCVVCKHWMAGKPVELSPCEGVSGAVRDVMTCDRFEGVEK